MKRQDVRQAVEDDLESSYNQAAMEDDEDLIRHVLGPDNYEEDTPCFSPPLRWLTIPTTETPKA